MSIGDIFSVKSEEGTIVLSIWSRCGTNNSWSCFFPFVNSTLEDMCYTILILVSLTLNNHCSWKMIFCSSDFRML